MTDRTTSPPSLVSAKPETICVIGGGIIGSWTALHLAEAGADTILLEQFPLPHTRGSSHGASRAFRFLGDDTVDRLDYSLERWLGLETDFGQELFARTGLLNFGPCGDPWLEQHMEILARADKPYDWLDAEQIRVRFPLLRYPDEWGATWDPNGGVLLAHRCLAAVQSRLQALGGRIVAAQAVEIRDETDGSVRIEVRSASATKVERVHCARAVVTAGPWTGDLIPHVRPLLTTYAIPVTYWRDTSGACSVANGFPILYNARLTDVYALPTLEYPGLVKVLFHGGAEARPEARDVSDRGPYVETVRAYVQRHLPPLDHRGPAIEESCMYTCTPDGEPVLDRLGGGIVVGCGFSGSGFKHSPATGRMLAALALGEESSLPVGYQMSKYARSRFSGRRGEPSSD